MGGNALKKYTASRITLEEYDIIKKDIKAHLNSSGIFVEFLIDLPGKSDFGDLDLLYYFIDSNLDNLLSKDKDNEIIKILLQKFHTSEYHINGPIISFAYLFINKEDSSEKYFQIDLNRSSEKTLMMNKFYFSYSDFSLILGGLSKYYGVIYGNNGIFIHIDNHIVDYYLENFSLEGKIGETFDISKLKNSYYGDINIIDSPKGVCDFLKLNYNKYLGGFTSKEEIFEWILEAEVCKKDNFNFRTFLSYRQRKRIKRRSQFIDDFEGYFIEKYGEIPENIKNTEEGKDSEKLVDLLEIYDKLDELSQMINNEMVYIKRKEKFGGHIFLKLGVDPKKISKKIEEFKKGIDVLDFNTYIDVSMEEEIYEEVKRFLNM